MLFTQTGIRCAAIVAACTTLLCCGPATAANSQPDGDGQKNSSPAESAVSTQHYSQQPSSKPSPQPVNGTVTYASAPVSGATVTLAGPKVSDRLHTLTDSAGNFLFDKVPAGEWTLTVKAEGMFCRSKTITVAAGEPQPYALVMEPVESSDVLRITGKRTLIHPENISNTTNLDRTFLDEYKSGNSLRDNIISTPGMQMCPNSCPVPRGETNAVNYVLDGVVLPQASGVMAPGQFVTPRSLQSLSAYAGGYQAQDGGGPLGAVVLMKSRSIESKPVCEWGGQLGGPLAGTLDYYVSSALSQDPKSILNRIRFESSGAAVATRYGLPPPVRHFVRNSRLDINSLTSVEFQATERDTFRLTAGVNETFLQLPTSRQTLSFGLKQSQQVQQHYIIASYKHQFEKWLDEADLHCISAFYSERWNSTNAFDPTSLLYGGMNQWSVSPQAKRLNYVTSIQGNVSKTAFATHHLKAGVLTELRPVSTSISETCYNAALPSSGSMGSMDSSMSSMSGGMGSMGSGMGSMGGSMSTMILPPYGGRISPFTSATIGPQIQGGIGKLHGFRYLQSAYFQDSWKPTTGILKRLTVAAGVRADVYYGLFGNTMNVADAIAIVPGTVPFQLQPFQTHTVCNAQASGRYGISYVLTKSTVLRAAYSDVFAPPPVDSFVRPFSVTGGTINGIFNGSLRPLSAQRGRVIDTAVEQQIGPRFACRTNLYYKDLKNFFDMMPVDNTVIMQQVNVSGFKDYGIETRLDLKPSRDGTGWSGFVSNTIAVAKYTGSQRITGGMYDIGSSSYIMPMGEYAPLDRRWVMQAGITHRTKSNFWINPIINAFTGTPDLRMVYPHPARTPAGAVISLNMGYDVPHKYCNQHWWMPSGVDVRILNISNQRVPITYNSMMYQNTRYMLPLQVLVEMNWHHGGPVPRS